MMSLLYGRTVLVFAAWTVTSFLCHFMAKKFLKSITNSYGATLGVTVASVLILTGSQILFCLTLIERPRSEKSTNQKAVIYILVMHTLATLMTNGSMAIIFAASTFAIKLLEPITGAFAQSILLGTQMSIIAWLSLPIIVTGAMIFTGNPLMEVNMSVGTILACVSNVSLALRNVAIKQEHIHKTEIKLHKSATFFVGIGLGLIMLCAIVERVYTPTVLFDVANTTTMTFTLLIGSSVFHVAYSYISTAIVLRELSVVSHAVGNIFKRLFVILLLYMGGSRTATVNNFLGLMVCTSGLCLYTWDKLRRRGLPAKHLQENITGKTLWDYRICESVI